MHIDGEVLRMDDSANFGKPIPKENEEPIQEQELLQEEEEEEETKDKHEVPDIASVSDAEIY